MGNTSRLEAALGRLRDEGGGSDAWRTFVEATRVDWDRMAADIERKWSIPPGVDAEDVRQELLLAVHEQRLLERWDGRLQSLGNFVVWNAYVEGKRFVHRQRAALRRDGKAPSRHPLAFSSLGSAREGRYLDAAGLGLEGVVEPDQEEAQASAELAAGFRVLLGCDRRRAAFDVLREVHGETAEAVRRIWNRPKHALACRIGSEAEAVELVAETWATLEGLIGQVFAA